MSFPVEAGGTIGWIYRDPESQGTDPSGIHSGVDIWGENNAPVAAMGTGVVSHEPEYFPSSDKWAVSIYYPSIGLYAYTTDLQNVQVTRDSEVSAGTVIGYRKGRWIHVSFATKDYNDQNPNWGFDTPHRDPTPYLAPNEISTLSKGPVSSGLGRFLSGVLQRIQLLLDARS